MEKMRLCLGKCRRMFMSRDSGHRICPRCGAGNRKKVDCKRIPRQAAKARRGFGLGDI